MITSQPTTGSCNVSPGDSTVGVGLVGRERRGGPISRVISDSSGATGSLSIFAGGSACGGLVGRRMSRVFSGSSLLSAIGNNYAMRRDGARQKKTAPAVLTSTVEFRFNSSANEL